MGFEPNDVFDHPGREIIMNLIAFGFNFEITPIKDQLEITWHCNFNYGGLQFKI